MLCEREREREAEEENERREGRENEYVCHMQESCVVSTYPDHLGPLLVVRLFHVPWD